MYLGSGTYNDACTSYTAGTTSFRGYIYEWKSAWGEWERQTSGGDYTDHILVNNGHSGVKLACQKSQLSFTVDFTNDKVRAISGDSGKTEFEGNWFDQNIPSTSRDDITDAVALGIPEFSTIIAPVASVLLIVGNRMRKVKTNQH